MIGIEGNGLFFIDQEVEKVSRVSHGPGAQEAEG